MTRKGKASKKPNIDVNALPHGLGVKPKTTSGDVEVANAAQPSSGGSAGEKINGTESVEAMSTEHLVMETELTRLEPTKDGTTEVPRAEAEPTELENTGADADDEGGPDESEPSIGTESSKTGPHGSKLKEAEANEPSEAIDCNSDGQDEQNEKANEHPTNASGVIKTSPVKPKTKNAKSKAKLGVSPYPRFARPTPDECYKLNGILSKEHGEVTAPESVPVPSQTVAGCGEVKFILEALVRTYISTHTSMSNANRAIQDLLARYSTFKDGPCAGSVDWNQVRLNSEQELEKAIRAGGMAPTKSKSIKQLLEMVYQENQTRRVELKAKMAEVSSVQKGSHQINKSDAAKDTVPGDSKAMIMARFADELLLESDSVLTLDYVHTMEPADAFEKLLTYPGIGIKTAACVLLFCMQRPFFAVDTHVWRICKWLGWVPSTANRDNTFWHCDVKVPNELKYSLHQLMIAHGKSCGRCRANTSEKSESWAEGCPIEEFVKRTGVRKGDKGKPKPKGKKRKAKTSEEDEYEDEGNKSKKKSRKVATKSAKGKAGTKKANAKAKGKKATQNEAAGGSDGETEVSRLEADFFKPTRKEATPPADESVKDLTGQNQEERANTGVGLSVEGTN